MGVGTFFFLLSVKLSFSYMNKLTIDDVEKCFPNLLGAEKVIKGSADDDDDYDDD